MNALDANSYRYEGFVFTQKKPNSRFGKREEKEMSIISSIGRIAAEFSAARARHHTERAIRSLPVELQKDIGWPDAFNAHSDPRHQSNFWTGNR